MSQWEMVDGKSVEVGLSEGQTAGDVGGTYVERPAGSDTATPYYSHEAKKEKNIYRDPQTQRGITADEAIRRGLEGGWKVENRFFLTEQAAKNEVRNIQARSEQKAIAERAAGSRLPWGAQQDLKAVRDLSKGDMMAGYKPHVTIEGTTVYTKPKDTTYTHPRFGKMVYADRGEPLLGVIQPDKFTKAIEDTISQKAKDFHYLDLEIASKLNLKEGVFQPALDLYRKTNIAWAETLPEEQRKRALSTDSAPTRFIIGAGGKLAREPLTFAGNLAFALLVTKGAGGLVSKVPALATGIGTGKVARNINAVNILGGSLAAMYGYDVTTRYQAAPDKAKFLGELTATELVPFAAGGYIGTRKIPKLPYTISKPKGGILIESKGLYTVPEPTMTTSSKSLSIIEKFPKKEGWATFASPTKDGLTTIYLRPPRSEIPKLMNMLSGKGEYVSTPYGSYFKITPETKISSSTLLKLDGKGKYSILEQIANKIPYKVSRRLEMQPANIRLAEQELRLGLPEKTWDYDIVADILHPGKGSMRSEPFGGLVKGVPTRSQLAVETRLQLTTPAQKTRLPVSWTTERASSPGEFKSLSDDKAAELAEYTRNIFKSAGVAVATVTQTKYTGPAPIITMPRTRTQTKTQTITQPMPQPQVSEQAQARRILQVADRPDTRIADIEKLFKNQAQQPTQRVIKIDRSQFPSRGKPASSIMAVYNLFQNEGIADKKTPYPKAFIFPAGFIQPSPSLAPSPFQQPRPSPQQQPKPQPKPKPKPTPTPDEPTKTRTPRTPQTPPPRRLPPLKPKDFSDEIDSLSKRRKKGKYIWNIRNPVPTLEQLLGSSE